MNENLRRNLKEEVAQKIIQIQKVIDAALNQLGVPVTPQNRRPIAVACQKVLKDYAKGHFEGRPLIIKLSF